MTITESKRHTKEDGSVFYQKHKIYLYKEDFESFLESFKEVKDFVIKEKGTEIISLENTNNNSDNNDADNKESVSASEEIVESSEDSVETDEEENKDLKFEDI